MTGRESPGNSRLLMVLSLLVAVLLWLFAAGEREGEIVLGVPLVMTNLPPSLSLVNKPPTRLEVTVAGPRLLLLRLRMQQLKIRLDLRGSREGTTVHNGLENSIRLEPGLHVTRLSPATIEVKTTAAKSTQDK
jgi:YbbR domain-containing protein